MRIRTKTFLLALILTLAAPSYVLGNCLIPAYVLGTGRPRSVQFPSTNFGKKAAEPLSCHYIKNPSAGIVKNRHEGFLGCFRSRRRGALYFW